MSIFSRFSKKEKNKEKIVKIVLESGFYNEDWYKKTYNISDGIQNPILHFIEHGVAGNSPGPMFDSAYYLKENPDVRSEAINPLVHYLQSGRHEGRASAPVSIDGGMEASNSTLEVNSPEQVYESRNYQIIIEYIDENSISGWCVNRASPSAIAGVFIYINGILYAESKADGPRLDLKKKGSSSGLGGFTIDNPVHFMDAGKYRISFRFPDGEIGAEFELNKTSLKRGTVVHPYDLKHHEVAIIVPVYNAAEDLRICLERLFAYTPETTDIIVINDKSTDPEIDTILLEYAGFSRIRIFQNDENLGFTRTVNRGMLEAGRKDVVLLNSDARVTPGWLQGLLVAAASSPRIATVTPMSDRAGMFSAPNTGNDNPLPEGVDEATYGRSFRRHSLGLYPSVPTGNGFCLFIRRACIDQIGLFDAEAFPRGYGEENDFCLRATREGWTHIVDDRTYVFHDRSKSFGAAKVELSTAGEAVLRGRYPEYLDMVASFSSNGKLQTARARARLALQEAARPASNLPRVLFVISTTTGGTPQTNKDLMNGLAGRVDSWLLRCDSRVLELSHRGEDGKIHLVRQHRLENPVEPLSHRSYEYDVVVAGWLFDFDIDIVHIRHLVWHSLALPEVARTMGCKVVISFHDFYALTPTVHYLDDAGVYMGDYFVPEGSIYRTSLWPQKSMPLPTGPWLEFWRERFQKAILNCDALVTTSEHARVLILEKLPALAPDRFFVIPHGRDFTEFHDVRALPRAGEPIRILIPGNINMTKGLGIIRALADHDREGKIEFHILGATQDPVMVAHPRIMCHGRYDRDDFASRAKAIKPHLGGIFSICDETYCHTLTELWSIGVPALVLDFPMVRSRVEKSGAGWVVDHSSIDKLYSEIVRIASDDHEQRRAAIALNEWQNGEGLENTVGLMSSKYYQIYFS